MIKDENLGPQDYEVKYCTSKKCGSGDAGKKIVKVVSKFTIDCPDCKSVLLRTKKRQHVRRNRDLINPRLRI